MIQNLLGAVILVATGCVIGYWIDELWLTPKREARGFYECRDCGASFRESERWIRGGNGEKR